MFKKYLNLPKKKKNTVSFFSELSLKFSYRFLFLLLFCEHVCVLCVCVHGRYRYMFMYESNHARRCTHLHRRKPEKSIIWPTASSSHCSFQASSLTEIGSSVLQLFLCIQQVKAILLCLFP